MVDGGEDNGSGYGVCELPRVARRLGCRLGVGWAKRSLRSPT